MKGYAAVLLRDFSKWELESTNVDHVLTSS